MTPPIDPGVDEVYICYSFCEWDDNYCWDACDHEYDNPTSGFNYFDEGIQCSDVSECALFNSTNAENLNDTELDVYMEELGDVPLSIEVEGQKINVTLGNLTAETEVIQEIFADEEFKELGSQT